MPEAVLETPKTEAKPIGDRILGTVDPKTLSREEFAKSPDLLFHGPAGSFTFSKTFDYSSLEYLNRESDGSQTLGVGFYATDSREAAENYSTWRQATETGPIVVEILPYNAKVFDFRSSANPEVIAPALTEFLEKWFQFYRSYYMDKIKAKHVWNSSMEPDYFQFLIKLKNSGKRFNLRQMLDTEFIPGVEGGKVYPYPPWGRLFAEFMREQGYDGLVYIEGGEGPKRKDHASYVFFNLDKIGTYESWHSPSATS